MPIDYADLKPVHIALASLSVLGFGARGLGVLAGAAWPMHAALRRATVLVDSLLLAAGLMLWSQLGWASMPWLWAKLGCLLGYIVAGSLALRRAPGRGAKAVCFVLALGFVVQLVATARSHHPLGVFA